MKKRIMAIASNPVFLRELKDFFAQDQFFEVVEGNEGLNSVKLLMPDVLIVELAAPFEEGMGLLQALRGWRMIKTVAISQMSEECFISKVLSLGVDYYMIKPLSFSVLKERIEGMFIPKIIPASPCINGKNTVEDKLTNIFITLGIPAHIKGYRFLREAIKVAMENIEMVSCITKKLYPAVASRFDTSPYKVERGIRHAIEVAWSKGKIININSIFGLSVYNSNDKPTNGEFIALIADKLILEGAS